MTTLALKNMILMVGATGVLLFALLMSYEFIELLTNIFYSGVLLIMVGFFYQNRDNAKVVLSFLFDIKLDDGDQSTSSTSSTTSKSQSILSSSSTSTTSITNGDVSSSTTLTSPTLDKVGVGATLTNSNSGALFGETSRSMRKSDKEIIDQLYEQIKELNLSFFNERMSSDKERLALQQKLKTIEAAATDANQERAKWKVAAEQQKAKNNELIKDRDHHVSSEQKYQSKVADYEKRERNWTDNEKTLVKKVSELKDTNSTLKRDVDDRTKRISKLEDQVVKLQKQLAAATASDGKEMQVISSSTSSSFGSYGASNQTMLSTPLAQQMQSMSPSESPSTSPESVITSMPMVISTSVTAAMPQPTASLSMNPQLVNTSNNGLFGLRDSSDDEDDSSPPSDTPKQLKNLFKKVKSGSSKIINKAQTHLNKHLHTEFFTPPITTATNQPPTTKKLPETPPATPSKDKVAKDIFGDPATALATNEPFMVGNTSDGASDNSKSIPDIFVFEGEEETLKDSTSLSELLSGGDDLNFSLASLIDTTSTSAHGSGDTVGDLFACIKEYSIKESENKAGLRRAKKKPLTPNASMMEDVSFAVFPFNGSSEMALFGVCDGHAGREAADLACKLFPIEIAKIINSQPNHCEGCDVSDLFVQAFAEVDRLMKEECQYVGCTATVAFVWTYNGGRYLQVANVGDSSAFICRSGSAVEMTFDHKASHPLEKKRMIEAGIPVTDQQTRINGVAVSRSLGNHFIKDQKIGMIGEPHLSKPILLHDFDTFLVMASDGLWDVVSGDRAIEIGHEIISSRGAQSIASTLLQTGLQFTDCKDNVTVIVVKL
ncbi:hypothetical protein SAMD00019534_093600 [Acytostelium subglobosum LB1]|uniref:hypothetical protein n=1 Tax=Acytostelium subglobosum LB1 TaxID=1410327 RepID=UPI000644B129|nr:hypothetical protein SAMD00019534_093600 [Acytostelium subglobosum LB1]GAM26185.1 hypothetical protein SAMD00019534_093600 [Acytostelium subglobosum LB1]|eukprot:XP_012750739.1 hypothetical protein SAMD00019534_093600 [Acytostelium subglobosum LB1]